jgi:hypothetical protein
MMISTDTNLVFSPIIQKKLAHFDKIQLKYSNIFMLWLMNFHVCCIFSHLIRLLKDTVHEKKSINHTRINMLCDKIFIMSFKNYWVSSSKYLLYLRNSRKLALMYDLMKLKGNFYDVQNRCFYILKSRSH